MEIGHLLRGVLRMTKELGHDSLSMLFGENVLVLSISSHASRRVVVKFLSFSSGLTPVNACSWAPSSSKVAGLFRLPVHASLASCLRAENMRSFRTGMSLGMLIVQRRDSWSGFHGRCLLRVCPNAWSATFRGLPTRIPYWPPFCPRSTKRT